MRLTCLSLCLIASLASCRDPAPSAAPTTSRTSPTSANTSTGTAQPSPGAEAANRLIFTDSAGRRLFEKDLRGLTEKVRWEVSADFEVSDKARELHAKGRELGAMGSYEEALAALDEAHRLSPKWPYPLYDAAFTHLLRNDLTKAEANYLQVDVLAPRGFFTAKAAIDSLRREREGKIQRGAYLSLVNSEFESNPDEKKRILRDLVTQSPDFPCAWEKLSQLIEDDDARLAAIEKGLAAGPDADTRGMLLMNKAVILNQKGQKDEAIRMLGTLALDPGSTIAVAELSKATLANLLGIP